MLVYLLHCLPLNMDLFMFISFNRSFLHMNFLSLNMDLLSLAFLSFGLLNRNFLVCCWLNLFCWNIFIDIVNNFFVLFPNNSFLHIFGRFFQVMLNIFSIYIFRVQLLSFYLFYRSFLNFGLLNMNFLEVLVNFNRSLSLDLLNFSLLN